MHLDFRLGQVNAGANLITVEHRELLLVHMGDVPLGEFLETIIVFLGGGQVLHRLQLTGDNRGGDFRRGLLRIEDSPYLITTTATMIAITFALVLMLPIGFLIELFLELLGIIFSFPRYSLCRHTAYATHDQIHNRTST